MNIRSILAVSLIIVAGVNAFGVTNDWENPKINSINRLDARTYSMPLANEAAAFTDALEPETPWKRSLNGNWRISWAGNPALRVRDFWKSDFDDSAWFEVDVPSCLETRGFGSPDYTNQRYPHADMSSPTNAAFAKILDKQSLKHDYNPVASYRTKFSLPADWKGREVILRFDGVYSAYYVWVNGKRVGYAEDSKLPSEFDITKFVQFGEKTANVLAVEVYRWCDGSYLEDQDMTRFTGIFRDVTVWSKPQNGIWDFAINARVEKDFATGRFSVDCLQKATWKLFDADFRLVASGRCGDPAVTLDKVNLWSAEKPYLYTAVLQSGSDIRMKRVGFKRQEVVGNCFKVNGKPVKFKGVNRHETNPDNGRTVSLEDMLADARLMKQYNINTVRTSHYPNHHLWYDICDRYGLYLVAEANVEAHEPGYDAPRGLGSIPEWDFSIVERNLRHVVFYRNNAVVTMWSAGNETGHGDCFRHAIAGIRALDPTRPVHWERGSSDADVDSRMYPDVEWLDQRGRFGDAGRGMLPAYAKPSYQWNWPKDAQHHSGRCAFICEYAHAMGTAMGDFADYWDVFYRYDSLCGGCIWDWVDQALWKYTDRIDPKTGKRERYLSYGGDFDEVPHDGPFNCNGVIGPLRKVSAKLVEVGHVHRNLVVSGKGDGVFELWNRHLFTFADEFVGRWKLRENGKVIASGAFDPPHLGPLARCRFTIGELAHAQAKVAPGAEATVDVEFSTRKDSLWAKAGWVVAGDQIALSGAFLPTIAPEPAKFAAASDEKTLTVSVANTKAVFCRRSGTLCELTMNGKTILKDPAIGVVTGPQLTCMRAFLDNDRWLREPINLSGLTQLRHHARPIRVEGNRVLITVEVTGSKSAGFTHDSVWTFGADGSIGIENTVTPHGTMPVAVQRLGLSFKLDKSLERMEYYGRGPYENYIDRNSGSFMGLWQSTVTSQFEPQVRPQDNGYKTDVRYVRFFDRSGKGVEFAASQPLFLQALHFGWEDLEYARSWIGERRRYQPLVPRPEVCLNLDVRQLGLGGGSCGPRPQAQYMYKAGESEHWTVKISPFERH